MIISISGKPGSGKSTVAKKLAAALGFERIYIGAMRRDMARKKGMTLEEFNTWSEKNEEGDKEFDEFIAKIGKEKDNIIIESRTAFHFIPHSLKIFLDVSIEEGARRIWGALQMKGASERNEALHLNSLEDVVASIHERLKSDKKRYEQYYQIDIFDPSHYDLYADTTKLNPDEEFSQVLSFVQKTLSSKA